MTETRSTPARDEEIRLSKRQTKIERIKTVQSDLRVLERDGLIRSAEADLCCDQLEWSIEQIEKS